MLFDVSFAGTVKLNAVSLEALKYSCVLDVADTGEKTLEEVGTILGLTRERVRQIEAIACSKLKEQADPKYVDCLEGDGSNISTDTPRIREYRRSCSQCSKVFYSSKRRAFFCSSVCYHKSRKPALQLEAAE